VGVLMKSPGGTMTELPCYGDAQTLNREDSPRACLKPFPQTASPMRKVNPFPVAVLVVPPIQTVDPGPADRRAARTVLDAARFFASTTSSCLPALNTSLLPLRNRDI